MKGALLFSLVANGCVGAYVYHSMGVVPVVSIVTEFVLLAWFLREVMKKH